jgi:hypothetical protein
MMDSLPFKRSPNRFTRRIDMAEKIDFTKPDAIEKLSERLTSGEVAPFI